MSKTNYVSWKSLVEDQPREKKTMTQEEFALQLYLLNPVREAEAKSEETLKNLRMDVAKQCFKHADAVFDALDLDVSGWKLKDD